MAAQDIEWAQTEDFNPQEVATLAGHLTSQKGTYRNPNCPPAAIMQGRYHDLKSEQMDQYRGETIPVTRVRAKQSEYVNRPFEGNSTNRADYVWHGNVERRQPSDTASKDHVVREQLPFDGTTTNQHDYRAWNSRPPALADKREKLYAGLPDDRSFETENSKQYSPKSTARRALRAPPARKHESLPFDGTTTHQSDFIGYNVRPAESYASQRKYRPRPDDRDFVSEKAGEYTKKPIEIPYYPPC